MLNRRSRGNTGRGGRGSCGGRRRRDGSGSGTSDGIYSRTGSSSGQSNGQFEVFVYSNKVYCRGIFSGSVTVGNIVSLTDNVWTHIGCTMNWDGTNMNATLYKNGVMISSETKTVSSYQYTSYLTRIGVSKYNYNRVWNGHIDEVMWFKDKVLTPSEMSNIYNNQSARFKTSGTHSLLVDLDAEVGSIEVTGDYQANIGSSLNLSLWYYNGSWNSAGEQVYDGDNSFPVNAEITNLTLNFTGIAGSNNGAYPFYSPIILGENGITLTTTTPCPYSGSGNWINDQYCEYTEGNYNVYGNITVFDGGTMNCTNSNGCIINFSDFDYWKLYEAVDSEIKYDGIWIENYPSP